MSKKPHQDGRVLKPQTKCALTCCGIAPSIWYNPGGAPPVRRKNFDFYGWSSPYTFQAHFFALTTVPNRRANSEGDPGLASNLHFSVKKNEKISTRPVETHWCTSRKSLRIVQPCRWPARLPFRKNQGGHLIRLRPTRWGPTCPSVGHPPHIRKKDISPGSSTQPEKF
jgi:hypothetical protein